MKVGILTGGGDCPGLNAAIRGFVLTGVPLGIESWGILEGWKGLVEGLIDPEPFSIERVEGIHLLGGTVLKTSRTNPYKNAGDRDAMLATVAEEGFEAIVVIGGDDTLGVAARLNREGVPAVGIAKTMDNDLGGTDVAFGFYSAVETAMNAIDRLRDTARSHDRVLVVEVMGRLAGWVALYSAVAGGADWVMVPERPPDIEGLCSHLAALRQRGKKHAVVVVSEGIELPSETRGEPHETDQFGHTRLNDLNVAQRVAEMVERRTGYTTRSTSIGYVQRGGSPTAFDRVLASRLGSRAAVAVARREFGTMAALLGTDIVVVPLELREPRLVPEAALVELDHLIGM